MIDNSKRDRLYSTKTAVGDFAFDAGVTHVFDDMVRRSVPGYDDMLAGIGSFSRSFTRGKANPNVFDLGCSLGSAGLSILNAADAPGLTLSLVDLSAPMIDTARERLAAFKFQSRIRFLCRDVRDLEIKDASFVVLNLTLQFLPPGPARQALTDKIYAGLNPGGALVVSEKIRFEDPHIHKLLDAQQMAFKRAQGYSNLEIAQKRTALENVMKPDTAALHRQRFTKAGFQSASLWYQNLNFVSFIALKA